MFVSGHMENGDGRPDGRNQLRMVVEAGDNMRTCCKLAGEPNGDWLLGISIEIV